MSKGKEGEPKAIVFTLVVTTIEDATDQVVIDDMARSIMRRLNLAFGERADIYHERKRLLDPVVDGHVSRHVPAQWGKPVAAASKAKKATGKKAANA